MEEPLTRNEQIHRWIPPAHLALPSSSPDHPTSYSAPSFAVSPTPVPTPFPPQPQMPTPLPTPGMIATPMTTAPTPTTQLPIAPSSFSPPNWPQPQYPYPGNWNQNGCPPVPQNDYSRFPTVPRSPYLNGNYSGDPNIMRVLDEKYGHPGEQQASLSPSLPYLVFSKYSTT